MQRGGQSPALSHRLGKENRIRRTSTGSGGGSQSRAPHGLRIMSTRAPAASCAPIAAGGAACSSVPSPSPLSAPWRGGAETGTLAREAVDKSKLKMPGSGQPHICPKAAEAPHCSREREREKRVVHPPPPPPIELGYGRFGLDKPPRGGSSPLPSGCLLPPL